MEKQKQTSFTFEIDNLWEKKAVTSPKFISGGCEWFADVYPKGLNIEDHLGLTLVLCVANPEALGLGWTGRAIFSFVLLNQSGKELYRVPERSSFFCDKFSKSGTSGILPLKKLKEKGVLEENKLIVIVQVKVVQVFGQGQGDVTEKEMFDDVKERIKNLILYMEKEEHMENLNVDPISIKEIKDWPKRVVRYWNELKFLIIMSYARYKGLVGS